MIKEEESKKIKFVIVPDFILDDINISSGEKLLFGDIASHSKQEGYCWGSNEYFAEKYHVSTRTITRWIADLEKRKLIISEMLYQKDSKKVSERRIVINTAEPALLEYMAWYGNQCLPAVDKSVYSPIDKNVQDNNKQVNNKCLINLNKTNTESSTLLNKDDYERLVNEFGKERVDSGIHDYSNWKKLKNAHPKSDYESLKKWIKKSADSGSSSYKSRMTAVMESGADEVSDKELDEISALI
ncbi:MAG: helix-turn-helix domain-containing protein [Treponema sp.]|nr:helix-turn-helix domain-containing protein [Treponema sp.]